MKEQYLPIALNKSEKDDIILKCQNNKSFYENVFFKKIDKTDDFEQEIKDITYGVIPRNFLLNIRNGIGRRTGIFKSSLGIQFAIKIDPSFNVKERLGMTPNELNNKLKLYADSKQIFLQDEYVLDLKHSAENRLKQIAISCREKELTFILIGAMPRYYVESDYYLERLGESDDKYLKDKVKINVKGKIKTITTGRKTVYYSLCKYIDNIAYYSGYIKFNITPLTDKKWRDIFEEYMNFKEEHQQRALQQNLTGFDFKEESKKIKSSLEYKDCFINDKLNRGKLKNLVYEKLPDVTKEERSMVYNELI